MPIVGVLALQGNFAAHKRALEKAGAKAVEVRTASELSRTDGLVMPGGESTTMLRLLHVEELWGPLQSYGREKPIFGTCAGAILLSSEVTHPTQESLALMDLSIERNGYGRQIDSRIAELSFNSDSGLQENGNAEAVFIRAPIIRRIGTAVRVLASYLGTPVLVEEGLHMAATFHPELSRSAGIHDYFVNRIGRL